MRPGSSPMSALTAPTTAPNGSLLGSNKKLLANFDIVGMDSTNNDAQTLVFEDSTRASSSVRGRTTPTAGGGIKRSKSSRGNKKSWISGSAQFRKMANWAFDVIDADGSGEVDEKELYSGLLLIHLKLGSYAGPAACKPVDRERVHQIFLKFDVDGSGSLDRDEFHEVMTVLCSNVFTRVLVQWSLTLMIVPMVAQAILDGIVDLFEFIVHQYNQWDDIDPLEAQIMRYGEMVMDYYNEYVYYPIIVAKSPPIVLRWGQKIWEIIDDIPEAVWSTVPVTLLSCILGCLVVPYCIFKIDAFFDWLADRNKDKLRKRAAAPRRTSSSRRREI